MWQWWFFICIHNCVSIFWFIARNIKISKNLKLSFNGQPNILFSKIICYTCDLHLKLNILNLSNIMFSPNGKKNESFALQLFSLNFWYDLDFHQIHQMNMYFHKKEHVFVVQKNLKFNVWLYAFHFIT